MDPDRPEDVLESTVAALAAAGDDALSKAAGEGFPDREQVMAWAERALSLLLHQRDRSALRAEVPALAERLLRLLRAVSLPDPPRPEAVVARFLRRLPAVRALLAEDVEAAFEGDPAARSYAEIVVAYPSIRAIASHRLAHELYRLDVPLIPRIITEHAHSRTGIDIHPGATIGRSFFIDHGTGIVIGETTIIGDNVKIYHGVTLGARAVRKEEGNTKRHPTIEDDVTIYPGATILGGETVIGRGSIIGGNVWLLGSVPPYSRIYYTAEHFVARGEPAGIDYQI